MEVLITGATGLLGHHLILSLRARGDRVRALVLPAEDTAWLEAHDVAVYRGDIRQPQTLTAPMQGAEIVFHLAAMQGVWRPMREYYAVNVMGTEQVCRAALAAGVRRLVHVSSWTIYGMARGHLVTEDFPPAPRSDPYWITKAQGDLLVQRLVAEEGLPAVIIRPGTLFGPGDRLNFGRIADRLRAGKGILIGSGRNVLPLVYVTDVAQALLLAADRARAFGQAYNITNDHPLTQEEFITAIAQELGVAAPRLHVPYYAAQAIALAAEYSAPLTRAEHPVVTRHGVTLFGTDNRHSIEKARAQLGYTPQMPLREGIGRATEWYRQDTPALTKPPSKVA